MEILVLVQYTLNIDSYENLHDDQLGNVFSMDTEWFETLFVVVGVAKLESSNAVADHQDRRSDNFFPGFAGKDHVYRVDFYPELDGDEKGSDPETDSVKALTDFLMILLAVHFINVYDRKLLLQKPKLTN